ncbi:MAG TPA: very short patch repair endonuclease [Candidatus Angelobacter sp.]
MTDVFTREKRSTIMARIHGKDTAPELTVRSLLHRMGYRFRLHRKDLPGRPDIVLPKHRAVIFVHGCFWHGHTCKRGARPTSNAAFWEKKITDNCERDKNAFKKLKSMDWRVLVLWQCQIQKHLEARLFRFLQAR